MTSKTKWTIISTILYIIYAFGMLFFKIIGPSQVGLPWTAFWLIAGAGIAYYLAFKNEVFERTMYYARALNLTQADLIAMLPGLKKSQVVPDPQKKHIMSPVLNFSLQNLNSLDRQVTQLAASKDIKPFH